MGDTSSILDSSSIRFNITDKELITDYLLKKIKNEDLPKNKIGHVDVFKHHPQTIVDNHPQAEKGKWYFFSPTNSSGYTDRKGAWGYWNARGNKKKISDNNGAIIGERTIFDHYEEDGTKTDWTMFKYAVTSDQEQLLDEPEIKLDDYVLCKIYKKRKYNTKKDEGLAVATSTDENENPPICDFNQPENSVFVQSEREREQVQVPAPDQPVPSSNQVADLGNLQFDSNVAVHDPVVGPPVIPPSPAHIDQSYFGNLQFENNIPVVRPPVIPPAPALIDQFNPLDFLPESYGTLDFNCTGPSYNPQEIPMTPLPYVDDDFAFTEFPNLDFFADDVNDG